VFAATALEKEQWMHHLQKCVDKIKQKRKMLSPLYDTDSVASLRLLSPAAATDGVAYFFIGKTGDFFSHRPLHLF